MTDQHKLYYHKLGTAQVDDKVVFGMAEGEKHRYVGAGVSDDDTYLFVSAANTTSGNKFFIKNLTESNSSFVAVIDNEASSTMPVTNQGSTLLLATNLDAPNRRVVKVDASAPQPANCQDLIAETEQVLNVSFGGGYLFARYMKDAVSQVKHYNYDGTLVRDIDLPGV